MPEIIGRFYLKQTTNRNLLGEFSNNKSGEIFTESADLMPEETGDNYVGKYCSTWREGTAAIFADLSISKSGQLFKLKWETSSNLKYEGEAMLCDNTLVGNYRSKF